MRAWPGESGRETDDDGAIEDEFDVIEELCGVEFVIDVDEVDDWAQFEENEDGIEEDNASSIITFRASFPREIDSEEEKVDE